jgi:acylphosphatase
VIIRRQVFVTGRVQGVGFRAATLNQAAAKPLVTGFVRNLLDGRVEAVFQGPEASVLQLVAWCGKGPISSEVTKLTVNELPLASGERGFEVLPDSSAVT